MNESSLHSNSYLPTAISLILACTFLVTYIYNLYFPYKLLESLWTCIVFPVLLKADFLLACVPTLFVGLGIVIMFSQCLQPQIMLNSVETFRYFRLGSNVLEVPD